MLLTEFHAQWKKWLKIPTVNHLLGIDIGADAIKLLKINHDVTPLCVEQFAIVPLPTDLVSKEGIKNPETIGGLLKDYLKQLKIEDTHTAISIPRLSVIIKDIIIDKRLTPAEIESRVWIEANRHFPELIGEVYLDFQITGTSATDPSQLTVMVIACRKDQVKPYLDLLHHAGLSAKVIDVNSYAFERALKLIVQADNTENIALLNLDLQLSSLVVLHKNELIYTLDQTFDGKRLISLTTDYLNANKMAEEEMYFSILRDNLISHLRHTMHFFYSSCPQVNIQKLILSGDCSKIYKIAHFIKNELGMETELADPFKDMTFAPHLEREAIAPLAPKLMLSCGLAMSKLFL